MVSIANICKTFDALPCRHFAVVCSVFWAFFFYYSRGLLKPPACCLFWLRLGSNIDMTFPAGHAPDFDAAPPRRKNDSCSILQLQQLLTSSRDARACSLISLDNSRSCARWPPVQAFLLTRCLPSGVLGPVDLAHGCHVRINSACRALRSGVQVVAMICLQ